MPRFTPKRFEQILAQMIARAVARSALSDVGDSSSIKHMLAASARQDDEQYFQMQNLLLLFSIDTATGDDLDARAAEIQPAVIVRIAAVKATGSVVFTRPGTTGTTAIPAGTKVKTADGVVFSTTAAGSITAGSPEQIPGHGVGRDSAPVAIIADLPGSNGNTVANTITLFESKPAVVNEVTNLTATANGSDKETDDNFRSRIKTFIAGLARCNVSAIEAALIGQEDPDGSGIILFSKVIEDTVNRGNFTAYIDNGSGTAESSTLTNGTDIAEDFTWNGSTTVTVVSSTAEIIVGDYVGLRTDNQLFEVATINPGVSFTINNPGSLTIPIGGGAGNSFKNPENVCAGLAGPPTDSAVGGEERLFLDNFPLKTSLSITVTSSTRGVLTEGVTNDYWINPASGQINFDPALVASEVIFAQYTYYTGLIAFAQKIVDGDPGDRTTYPGLRAAGVLGLVLTPQILIQTVELSITVRDGFEESDARNAIIQSVKDYINNLTISDDVIRSELIRRAMNTGTAYNVQVVLPANDIVILDDQLARTTDANITVN